MRSRPSHDDRVAEVTRRRLAALTAELGRDERAASAPAVPGAGTEQPVDLATDPSPRPRPQSPSTGGGRHARRPVPPTGRFTGWFGDHTPALLQGRAHLGSAQVGLVCLVVAVGLVVAAFWLIRAAGMTGNRGEVVAPRPVVPGAGTDGLTAATPGPDLATPAVAAPAASGPTGGPQVSGDQIVVDVAGKVRRPGIAVLPAGSRVVDAVRAAGGVRRGVPPGSVNMARLLTDGEQVLVGGEAFAGSVAGAALSTPGAASAGALVNLNTADQVALESLPSVGPVTAAAILQWRTEHGGFTSVDELLEVSGIGEATLAEIAPHVTL